MSYEFVFLYAIQCYFGALVFDGLTNDKILRKAAGLWDSYCDRIKKNDLKLSLRKVTHCNGHDYFLKKK